MPTATAPKGTEVAVREKPLDLITRELEQRQQALLDVLPPGMDAKRFTRVSLLAISKNPDLLTCTPTSVIRSIIEAAEIGIEPTGSLNRAWLVPFKEKDGPKEAQLIIGYQGYADLMRDGDKRRRVVAEVVYEGDHFKVVKGTEEPRIEHEPAFKTEDPTKINYAYAIIFYPDGTNQFEVMTRQQIELVRAKSRQRNGKAWTEGYGQMSRKSALRRLSNYTPLTARAIEAISRDDEREYGTLDARETVGSAAARVKERIKARHAKPAAEQEVEGTAVEVAPTESAGQQANDAQQAACGVVEGSETCGEPQGHNGPHKSAEAAWPREKPTTCGDVSPHGGGAICDLPPGHGGVHKSGENESWRRT